jgi:hypothetical protein
MGYQLPVQEIFQIFIQGFLVRQILDSNQKFFFTFG